MQEEFYIQIALHFDYSFLFYLQAGLATLFKADRLYNADYHSLTVHFRPICAVSFFLSQKMSYS